MSERFMDWAVERILFCIMVVAFFMFLISVGRAVKFEPAYSAKRIEFCFGEVEDAVGGGMFPFVDQYDETTNVVLSTKAAVIDCLEEGDDGKGN